MDIYIKSRLDFSTYAHEQTTDWTIQPDSDFGAASDFELPSMLPSESRIREMPGDILIARGFVGVIKSADPSSSGMKIRCDHITTLFNRSTLAEPVGDYLETQLASLITQEFISQSDPLYALPYITVTAASSTPGNIDRLAPTLNVYELITALREQMGIYTDVALTSTGLAVTIGTKSFPARAAVMGDGHNTLLRETYAAGQTAKVTAALTDPDTLEVLDSTDWYLMLDGTVTDDPGDSPRAYGAWQIITTEDPEEDLTAQAQEILTQSGSGHQIEFYSDREFLYGSPIKLQLTDVRVIASRITCITKKCGDSRTLYRCGALKTTLTEKLKGVIQ